MNHLTGFLKRHSLICGIFLMFLFTWPIDLANAGIIPVANRYTTGNQAVLLIFIMLEALLALVITIRQSPARLTQEDQIQVQSDPLLP